MSRIRIFGIVFGLCASILVPIVAQAATLNVPKTSWPVCSTARVTYCVESVSIQSPGGVVEPLTWSPSGTPASSSTTTTTTPTTTTAPTTTTTTPTTTTTTTPSTVPVAGTSELAGVWTDPAWAVNGHNSLGFNGVFIDAKAANVFTNEMFIEVRPVLQDPSSAKVYQANQPGTNFQTSLSPDDLYTVVLRTGDALAGVSMAIGNNLSVTPGTDANGSTLTFTGSAVPTAVAKSTNDCAGESGVAVANATELQLFLAETNDPMNGFGVDGVSGKMIVESNGGCVLATPVWISSSKTLTWTVAAPHFAVGGSTINKGFYKALIPVADAALLWGLTNPNDAATALQISVTSDGSSSSVATSSISVKGGNIIVSSTNFNFSKPTFKLSKNPKYKPSALKKKTTIRCVRGKVVKRITAVKPMCPAGFKRRV
jgi:hypothetical protein